MSDTSWPRALEIFQRALAIDPAERHAFVRSACEGDLALAAQVAALLLASEHEDDFLERPALDPRVATKLFETPPAPAGGDVPDALVGTTIDGLYHLEAVLGRGGMGTVYRARHVLLKDTIALKLLPRTVSEDPTWRGRFLREGQAARRLRHPNAVAVHDLRSTEDGLVYLVLEYVEGRTLRAEMRARSRMSAELVLRIVGALAGALDAAHRMGIVHRDVKPENVMIGTDRAGEAVVKLLDLGIAKLTAGGDDRQGRAAGGALTREGTFLGTPRYMSPEQWGEIQRDGQLEIDGRADVYSLGVMTYEMTCGEPPFRGDGWQELRRKHVREAAVPTHERVAGLPEKFGRAIERAMAKDRGDRFATAGAFALALAEALGMGTAAEADTRRLGHETGAGAEVGAATAEVDARTDKNPSANLPDRLTSLVGREPETEEVKRLLGEARLVTVAGPGGIGKTRLAVEAAREALDRFADGVWFVDLAPITDPGLVASALASALGVRERPGVSALDAVCDHAREKRLLIVLDNCEHLLDACGELAGHVLRACPNARILATSREELGVIGETVWYTPPLAEGAAVRLFAERARAVRRSFAVTEGNAEAVAELCRRLEGIPLALELAAARVGVLTPAQMLQRIGQRLDLLASRQTAVPSRHRTLRASIEWSHGLLDEQERAAFAALSVFRGGWTLEAAEQVARGPWPVARAEPSSSQSPSSRDPQSRATGHGPRATGVLDVLDRLRAASLVVTEEGQEEMRYRMLETIREFAAERVAERDEMGAVDTRQRHAEFFAELAERARPHLERADPEWVERLDAEHDNVRAALERCGTGVVTAETGLRIVASWWQWWKIRGHLLEGRAVAEAALARCPEGPPALRAKALVAVGQCCVHMLDCQAAWDYTEEAVGLFRELGDRAGVAWSLQRLSNAAYAMSEYDRATTFSEESLAIAREIGDEELVAGALLRRGISVHRCGDHDAAAASFEEAIGLLRAQDRRQELVHALYCLGDTRLEMRDFDCAEALYEEALAAAREGGYAFQIAALTLSLGELSRQRRAYDRAGALCAEALDRFRALGASANVAISLNFLGAIDRATGEYDRATERLRECLAVLTKSGTRHFISDTFEELAGVATATGRPERAARLLGAAEELRDALGTPISPADLPTIDATAAAARAALGDEAFDAALAAGRALTLDEAVAEALQDG
jgi:predicted ATPase/serine/threonine protein kinase